MPSERLNAATPGSPSFHVAMRHNNGPKQKLRDMLDGTGVALHRDWRRGENDDFCEDAGKALARAPKEEKTADGQGVGAKSRRENMEEAAAMEKENDRLDSELEDHREDRKKRALRSARKGVRKGSAIPSMLVFLVTAGLTLKVILLGSAVSAAVIFVAGCMVACLFGQTRQLNQVRAFGEEVHGVATAIKGIFSKSK